MIVCLGFTGCFLSLANSGLIALASLLNPTAIRSTGVGWVMGVGHLGSLIGPLVGVFIGRGWQVGDSFAAIGIPSLCAALFTSLIGVKQPRRAAEDDRVVVATGTTWKLPD